MRGSGSGWGVRVDVNEELKFLQKLKKKKKFERRIEVFVKIPKKNFFLGGGRGGRWGGVGAGVRVDVNEELKFL